MSDFSASPRRTDRFAVESTTSFPDDEAFTALWGKPSLAPERIEWRGLKRLSGELAAEIPVIRGEHVFGSLVGSEDLRAKPVHRWFTYKEGYSPDLLGAVISRLGLGQNLKVIDAFGGVATTAMSGLVHPGVDEVRSLEYSPFALFAGRTKLLWPTLDLQRLKALLPSALDYDRSRPVTIPDLAAFSNPEIFTPARIRTLLAARDHLREFPSPERDFFLLGLAAVAEDLSGAMKDGRALRIKGLRSRRASSLSQTKPFVPARGPVRRALGGQWSAMANDLADLVDTRTRAARGIAHHVRGDARDLAAARLDDGSVAFPESWADLSLFSPPYLNCIDYTELYKIELWLMEHIASQAEFREARLGTLRSHPSVKFPERWAFEEGEDDRSVRLVRGLSDWLGQHGARRDVGPVIRHYFEDMLQVWREQLRVLAPGASTVCVVANSTFSRRVRANDGERRELWRLPVLTDVVLAHLALLAGFETVEIWEARHLRPRNIAGGRARESLVVAQKT